jgi:Fe-S-cluster-containing hydrogenase component 2
MSIVCKQCKEPACRDSCPVGAITVEGGVVVIDDEKCIACQSCAISCPDGAIFVHSDIDAPFKCDLCGGDPVRVRVCPKKAILFVPEHALGQVHRMASALGYAHLQEVEYWDTVSKRRFNTRISGRIGWNRVSPIQFLDTFVIR